jgi:hypothetical protein
MTRMADEDLRESELPPDLDDEGRRRVRLERILGGAIRRGLEKGIEAGLGTLSRTDNVVRELVGDNVKLPKELVGYVFSQVDETKNAMVRVVAGEVRDFLSATDLANELQKALTSLSFEIKTEIRFIPNDSGGVKPDVKAEVDAKRKGKKIDPSKSRWRKSEPPPPPAASRDDAGRDDEDDGG